MRRRMIIPSYHIVFILFHKGSLRSISHIKKDMYVIASLNIHMRHNTAPKAKEKSGALLDKLLDKLLDTLLNRVLCDII